MSWVNCPRRFFPYYQNLKQELNDKGPILLESFGVDWGLACNSVHHIDLLAFLSGDQSFTPSAPMLENEIFESKRKGFIEFYGSISGYSNSNNRFNLTCNRKKEETDKPWLNIRISHSNETILIDEGTGKAEYFKKGNDKPYRVEPFKIIYQSGLTHLQIKQILEFGESYLPSLEESYEIHKPLLQIFREHYQKIMGKVIQKLPIT